MMIVKKNLEEFVIYVVLDDLGETYIGLKLYKWDQDLGLVKVVGSFIGDIIADFCNIVQEAEEQQSDTGDISHSVEFSDFISINKYEKLYVKEEMATFYLYLNGEIENSEESVILTTLKEESSLPPILFFKRELPVSFKEFKDYYLEKLLAYQFKTGSLFWE